MNTAKNPAGNNPAQIKGDINKGITGDKRPGFDPAAAPLETDGEAAGTPLSDEQVATARETQRQGNHPQQARTFGNAMRRFDGVAGHRPRGAVRLMAFAALVLALLAAALVLGT